jgi:hypothetical protein
MTKILAALDAITDVVFGYRPNGEPPKPVVKKRKNIKVNCQICGAKAGFFCASNCPTVT